MEIVYRGTQHVAYDVGVRQSLSFAYSLPVAAIWSSKPGDVFAHRKCSFLSTSTVHTAQINAKSILKLGSKSYMSLRDVLKLLKFGSSNGITESEVYKVHSYLHNRIMGTAKGGDFSYIVYDYDHFEKMDEQEIPLSFRDPQSLISILRDDWEFEPTFKTASRLVADTFIFADSPSVQHAAKRLGYDAFTYTDAFQGGEQAAEELFNCDVKDLDGIAIERDIEDEYIPVHRTLRPLESNTITNVVSVPTAQILIRCVRTLSVSRP